jgi:SAM-dependent methyltransferase
MGSYLGKHAAYYDIFYRDKPYEKEAEFIHQLLTEYSKGRIKTLLELACGTGKHALVLEKLGYQIVATDYSEDLLAVAQQKATAAGSKIEFREQDMRELNLPERFDAVYCLFDSIGYVQTNEAIRKVLDGVSAQLKSGGLFVFEFWHAAAMLTSFEPRRERHWQLADGELVRVSTTKLDVPRQLAEVSYEIKEFSDGKLVGELKETQVNRFFLVQEMAAFLEQSGFRVLNFLHAYDKEAVIDGNTWHVLAVAQRS